MKNMDTTKIVKEIDTHEFRDVISKYTSNIVVNPHAQDHISDGQRKIFDVHELIDTLLRESPAGVGLQANGRYAVFYRRKYGFLRIIVEVKNSRLEITTFLNTDSIPNLKRL